MGNRRERHGIRIGQPPNSAQLSTTARFGLPGAVTGPYGDDMGRQDDAGHWRKRAHESRLLAARISDPKARRTMLRIADHYENLAHQAERLADRSLIDLPTALGVPPSGQSRQPRKKL